MVARSALDMNDGATPRSGNEQSLATLQSEMLSKQAKLGRRAPGRARVDRIIETAIELLSGHSKNDISMAMIANRAGMTRTSVYAHFNKIDEIFEQISLRFVQQTGLFVESYVRERNPASLAEVVVLTVDAVQDYFNRPNLETQGAQASHVPFDARQVVQDYDKVSALTYHSLWRIDWPVEPLSDDDPFRLLVILQSALFETSIRRHGRITETFAEEAKIMALDLLNRTERRFAVAGGLAPAPEARLRNAAAMLADTGDIRLMTVAASQIEALTTLVASRQKGSLNS